MTEHAFKDAKGRTWLVEITVAEIKAVRREHGFDLHRLFEFDTGAFATLMDDPVMFGDVLFTVCRRQCDERGIDESEFLAGLAGDSIEQAQHTFADALAGFFPDGPIRRQMLAFLAKVEQVRDAFGELAQLGAERLESIGTRELLERLEGGAIESGGAQ